MTQMRRRRDLSGFLYVAPAVLLFAGLVLLPFAMTIGFSFFDWNGFGAMSFRGLANYARAFNDRIYILSYWHVAIYIVLTLFVEVGVGLLLAQMVSLGRPGSAVFRTAFFSPVMLSSVVVSLLWIFVYNDTFGIVNTTLRAMGLGGLTRIWLGDKNTALYAVTFVSGWMFSGFYMTIFYAGIKRIPEELYEAAFLEGAGERQVFRSIKVPLLRDMIGVSVLLCVTGAFKGFDLFYVLTNGGPYNSSEIVTTWIVRTTFHHLNVGYGAALSTIMTALVLLATLAITRLSPAEKMEF